MTIAITGNIILDAAARKGVAASKKEAARAKSTAKKSSKGGKFKGSGRAGRAAACRPAKGITAKRFKRKSSGSATAKYGLKQGAELIACNCGYDISTIAIGLAPKMRPEIKDQIERLSFSTPASSGKATSEEWRTREEFIRREIGIDESFSYCVSRHTDAEHDHIHLDFNRVSDVGKLWKDNQIGLRLAVLEEKIEKRFALKLTAREDFVTHGNISKKVVERAMREQVQPAFLQIQTAIQKAARDNPSVLTFIRRLADQGITARPNMKKGELNGFGYKKDEQLFTGKQLGANWSQLKELVTYVKNEHALALADHKRNLDEGKARPSQQDKPAESKLVENSGGQPKMEGAQRQSIETTQNSTGKPIKEKQSNRQDGNLPANPRHDGRYSVNHFDLVTVRVRAKMFPRRDDVIAKLKTIKGNQQLMAQRLAAIIEKYDYTKEAMATEFLQEFEATSEAVTFFNGHVPDVLSATIKHITEPFEKARQNKASAQFQGNQQRAELQKKSGFNVPSMQP
jgi:hypothetical protein